MPPPKRKYVKSRQGKRQSHLHLKAPAMSQCPQCGGPRLTHRVCPSCGSYAGREVVEIRQPKKKTSK